MGSHQFRADVAFIRKLALFYDIGVNEEAVIFAFNILRQRQYVIRSDKLFIISLFRKQGMYVILQRK